VNSSIINDVSDCDGNFSYLKFFSTSSTLQNIAHCYLRYA